MPADAAGLRWTVAQIGAREHYAIPAGFEKAGRLRRLYTDIWTRLGKRALKAGPLGARALATRHHSAISGSKVTAFSTATLLKQFFYRSDGTRQDAYKYFEEFGQWFGKRVASHLANETWDRRRDVLMAFNTGALECIRVLNSQGVLSIVDQIDPGRVEEDLVQEERSRFPGWATVPGRIPDSYFYRLEQEWTEASLVMVNSEWSKAALVKQGVPAEKIFVAPVIYDLNEEVPARPRHHRRLKALWLGQVIVRKGIQYVLEAAKALPNVDFDIAGPVLINEHVVRDFPQNVRFLGRVSRDLTADLYRQSDLFILPTVSDGFAITQLEAMAQGLPVITTPNCGAVVTHEVDGLIVPARDGEAFTQAIARLDADRALLEAMSQATARKLPRFSSQTVIGEIETNALKALAARGLTI